MANIALEDSSRNTVTNSSVAVKRRWSPEFAAGKSGKPSWSAAVPRPIVRAIARWAEESDEIGDSAKKHGHDLLKQGFTIDQVVHDYGDVCQSITDLAVELGAPISTDDFRTLNRCLDNAIAGAVTEFTLEQGVTRRQTVRRTARVGRDCDIRVPDHPGWQCGSRREHRGRG